MRGILRQGALHGIAHMDPATGRAWDCTLDEDQPARDIGLHHTQVLRGDALCTGLAALPPMDALTVAWFVLPHLLAQPMVSLAATETVAGMVSNIAFMGVSVNGYHPQRTWALAVRSALSKTTLGDRDAEFLHGVIATHATPRWWTCNAASVSTPRRPRAWPSWR